MTARKAPISSSRLTRDFSKEMASLYGASFGL